MRSQGSAAELEKRRRLAVQRVAEGWTQKAVADFLGVTPRAVGSWVAAHRKSGDAGLNGKPHPGASPKLSKRQTESVLAWLARSPRAWGYQTELWTTRRLAEVIEKKYKIRFNANYLADWLTQRGYTPQKPQTKAVERNNVAIGNWISTEWPRIQKKRSKTEPMSS